MKFLSALTAVATIAASPVEAAPCSRFICESADQLALFSGGDAIAWASKIPVIDGFVEVHAGYPLPGMAM